MTPPTPHPLNPDRDHPEALPSDLAPIARALDRLAALDAAAMPADLVERIAASTSARLIAREVSHLDALSTRDRAAAASTLEDRIFMATRGLITQGAAARLHEPADRSADRAATRPRRAAFARRVAIAAGLIIAVGLALPLLRPNSTNTPSTTTPPQVASAIQSDLDELAALIDTTDTRDDVVGLNVALRSVEDAIDDDPLKTAIDDGGAL